MTLIIIIITFKGCCNWPKSRLKEPSSEITLGAVFLATLWCIQMHDLVLIICHISLGVTTRIGFFADIIFTSFIHTLCFFS